MFSIHATKFSQMGQEEKGFAGIGNSLQGIEDPHNQTSEFCFGTEGSWQESIKKHFESQGVSAFPLSLV
jgi:hypothetical protein